jgi:hypothetical protein
MDFFTRIYRLAPLPDSDSEEFEAFFVDHVLPAVDTGQTRAGRIINTTLFKDTNAGRADHYVWLVNYEGVNAGWVDANLADAMEQLKSVALPVSSALLVQVGQ